MECLVWIVFAIAYALSGVATRGFYSVVYKPGPYHSDDAFVDSLIILVWPFVALAMLGQLASQAITRLVKELKK